MLYDLDYYYPYRSSYYYSRPRYYTTYTPSYYIGDRYYNPYRYYRSLYTSPSSYARTRAYLPYTPLYTPSIDYKYSYYDTPTVSKLLDDIPTSRFTRAVSLEPAYSSDYYTRRALSRARLMSEEPRTTTTVTRYFYY